MCTSEQSAPEQGLMIESGVFILPSLDEHLKHQARKWRVPFRACYFGFRLAPENLELQPRVD